MGLDNLVISIFNMADLVTCICKQTAADRVDPEDGHFDGGRFTHYGDLCHSKF
jgi:hypothetical protein